MRDGIWQAGRPFVFIGDELGGRMMLIDFILFDTQGSREGKGRAGRGCF